MPDHFALFFILPNLCGQISLYLSGFSRDMATIFCGSGRLLTAAASNGNYELKNSQSFNVILFGSMLTIGLRGGRFR